MRRTSRLEHAFRGMAETRAPVMRDNPGDKVGNRGTTPCNGVEDGVEKRRNDLE